MRYRLAIINGYDLPKNEGLLSTFIRGIKAFQEKKDTDNPYDIKRSPAFWTQWYRGWMAGHEGYASYSEPESRERWAKEIVWLPSV